MKAVILYHCLANSTYVYIYIYKMDIYIYMDIHGFMWPFVFSYLPLVRTVTCQHLRNLVSRSYLYRMSHTGICKRIPAYVHIKPSIHLYTDMKM